MHVVCMMYCRRERNEWECLVGKFGVPDDLLDSDDEVSCAYFPGYFGMVAQFVYVCCMLGH